MARKSGGNQKPGSRPAKATDLLVLRAYESFLGELKERIRTAQLRAAVAVNRELVLLYWQIGRDVLWRQKEHGGGPRSSTGSPPTSGGSSRIGGFSPRNLKYTQAFAKAWPDEAIVQETLAQITSYHMLEKIKDRADREWYARQIIENGWTRRVAAEGSAGEFAEPKRNRSRVERSGRRESSHRKA